MSNKELAEWTYRVKQLRKRKKEIELNEFMADRYKRKMNNRRVSHKKRLGQP